MASQHLDVFSWSPPPLIARPRLNQLTSKRTCDPGFFDKHFSEKIRLLRVKRLPTLIRDFIAIVDKIIANGVQSPPLNPYSARDFSRVLDDIEIRVLDEKEVASFYERTTATFCLGVASTLALGVPSLLRWNQSANVSGDAIADGFLYFADPNHAADRYAQLEVRMGKETVNQIRLMAEKRSSLATYEFKKVASDREEVMHAVPNLSNMPIFDCKAPDCATLTKHEAERTKVHEVLVERNMGPDAKSPIWTLNHPGVASSTEKRKWDDDRNDQNKVTPFVAPEPRLTLPLPTRRSARLGQNDCSSIYGVVVITHDETLKVTPTILPPPLHVETASETGEGKAKGKGKEVADEKGKVQGRNDNEDGEEGRDHVDIDPSYKDKDDLSALYIVQQVWAQATKADTSIVVVQSGNCEFVGIRHRRSQTLYISDIIQPHACEPSYGKFHVGIYVAAVMDAIDRAKQRAAGDRDGPDSGGPSGDSSGDHEDDNKARDGGKKKGGGSKKKGASNPQGGGSTSSGGTMTAMAVHERAAKRTLGLASRRNVVLLYLQYDVYDSPSPSTFIRASPNGDPVPRPSLRIFQNYRLDECLSIVLKSEIGHGATGKVLRGTLSVEASSACVLLDIVVKLALGSERGAALRDEYKIYHLMRKSGVTAGITTPLGLFDDVEGGVSALVMPYAGTPLAAMPEFVLTRSYQEGILANLKEIHAANVLHGDLRLDNILVEDSGLTIIDFNLSQVCCDPDAKNREYSQLQSLLARHSKRSSIKNRMKTDIETM